MPELKKGLKWLYLNFFSLKIEKKKSYNYFFPGVSIEISSDAFLSDGLFLLSKLLHFIDRPSDVSTVD